MIQQTSAQDIVNQALAMLGNDITQLMLLSPEENKARRLLCKDDILEGGLYPLVEGYSNHQAFALNAFKKFDPYTKQEFMRAFKAITLLNEAMEEAEIEGRQDDWNLLREAEKTLYPSTQLLLYEREKDMIVKGATKESLTHATMLITKTPSLIDTFKTEYVHQLQALGETSARQI